MYLIKWKHKFFKEWGNKEKESEPKFVERKSLAYRFNAYKDAENITKKLDVKMKILEEKK